MLKKHKITKWEITIIMANIKVLVVDDSALMRNIISQIVVKSDGLEVADKASNGQEALEKIKSCKPDIVVLDIQMPVMDGIEFLKTRKNLQIDIPVIVLSSVATRGTALTMQCLELGAVDFVTKPNAGDSTDLKTLAEILSQMLVSYGQKYIRTRDTLSRLAVQTTGKTTINSIQKTFEQKLTSKPTAPIPGVTTNKTPGKIEIIAIGISTGGPNALREVFAKIDPSIRQPILVVQHMPAGFTQEFATSLNGICPLEVTEAKDGETLTAGHIYIAPGSKHMYIKRTGVGAKICLSEDAPRNGHRPSADVLFESVAKEYQNKALGVIMTGMGNDGAKELVEMRKQGAHTIGQDEESSIVYGMPRVAYEMGAVQKQVSLENMAQAISCLAKG